MYNWKSTGPGGCDTHCIEHPCGPCITGYNSETSWERASTKKLAQEAELLAELLVAAIAYMGNCRTKKLTERGLARWYKYRHGK